MFLSQGLKVFRYLSLDVALGTVCMSISIADLFDATVKAPVLIVLFISTWIVYTLDHLLDAFRYDISKFKYWSNRHKYHFKYKKNILIALIIALFLQCILLFLIPIIILKIGAVLVILVSIYLFFTHFFTHKSKLIKECTIALIYSISLIVPIFSTLKNLDEKAIVKICVVFIALFLISISNIFIITCYESENEKKLDEMPSFGAIFGKKKGLSIVFMLLLAYLIFILLNSKTFYNYIGWLIIVIILIFIVIFNKYFEQKERYRKYADMIFFIPYVFYLLDF